jgi:TRAP transporter TAXI family solute receptor
LKADLLVAAGMTMKTTPKQRRVHLDVDAWSNVELAWITGIASLVLAGGLWLILGWHSPPPETTLRIASGPASGAYFQYAARYRGLLAEHGIAVEVQETKGTVENLAQLALSGAACCMDVALAQGGPWRADASQVQSLATVALEPIWIFVNPRRSAPQELRGLRGQTIAVGAHGSGTLPVAEALLEKAGIGVSDYHARYLSGPAALEALRAGDVSAAFLIASASAPIVQTAIAMELRPLSMGNAAAFERHLPWAQAIDVPRGVLSIEHDIPSSELTMLAVETHLVTRADLHDSLKFLLLEAAHSAHSSPALLRSTHSYPSAERLQYPQSEASKEYFKNGRPWLHRYLAPWRAHQINRIVLSLLPVFVVLLPLVRALVAFNERRNKAAIMRILTRVKELRIRGDGGQALVDETHRALLSIERDLQRLRPLTIHALDYFRMYDAYLDLRRQAGRRPSAESEASADFRLPLEVSRSVYRD